MQSNEVTYSTIRDIVIGKLVDKTIDKDYEELSESLFGDGNCFSSSEVRKRMYGMKTVIDAIERDGYGCTDIDTYSDVSRRTEELDRMRQQFYDQRREYKKLTTEDYRLEHLYSVLEQSAANLGETVGRLYEDVPYSNYVETDDIHQNDAVLFFSDWHYGMIADNAFNRFNTGICKARVKQTVDMAASRIYKHGCRDLHIVMLGDMINGSIHVSSRVASEELVVDQMMQATEIFAQSIIEMSQYVSGNTYVYSTYGNHARVVPNKKDNIHRDNLERFIPWWLKERLKDYANIKIMEESENEFIVFDVCGYNFCATHGDLDSVKGSPKTLYTMLMKTRGVDVDYVIMGDKHHIESFDELGVTSILCGSLCGTDEYANNKRLYSKPSQLLLIVNETNGVDAEYKLKI